MEWADKQLSRRKFIRLAGGAIVSASAFGLAGCVAETPEATKAATIAHTAEKTTASLGEAKVFFTNDISVKGLLSIYSHISETITGKVAIKLHSGEPNGPNLLPLDLIKGLQPTIPKSAIVECNVLYNSPRQTTAGHRKTIQTNGFTFCPVDIMDEEKDVMLPVPAPYKHLQAVPVGSNLLNYESMLVYTHFKGHAMGGFGGSLKNIGIGVASKEGKRVIHGEGWPVGEEFLERMVESGDAIASHFKGRIAYINVLKNMSVDCDCDAHGALPTCSDIGILASTDILAIDQASIDLVYKLPEDQRRDLAQRIESRKGLHQLTYMKERGMGSSAYRLVQI